MESVFVMGVLKGFSPENNNKNNSSRAWGIYKHFKDAEEAILNNYTDIFEHFYNYAVIEEIPVIDFSNTKQNYFYTINEWWYEATYDPNDYEKIEIKKIQKPEHLKQFVAWFIG